MGGERGGPMGEEGWAHGSSRAQGMRALTKALAAGAWPHMPTHPRRDPRGKAGEGRLRAGFGVPPLDDEGLRDELLVALDARQQAAVARQEAAAI